MDFMLFMYLVCSLVLSLVSCEHVIQTFHGEIGAGNFSYFELKKDGEITLILESIEGDADIYVSQEHLKPDYDHYDLKSTTCGEDIVTIPSHYKRPVGISVFGHVYAPQTKYTMKVLLDYSTANKIGELFSDSDDHEESIIWTLFISILKLILEIIV